MSGEFPRGFPLPGPYGYRNTPSGGRGLKGFRYIAASGILLLLLTSCKAGDAEGPEFLTDLVLNDLPNPVGDEAGAFSGREPGSSDESLFASELGSLHFTWYLSPELESAENLKSIDEYLAKVLKALEDRAVGIQTLVRAPYPGERRPNSLFPIPATDVSGESRFLWSSLVLDGPDRRIVIPDLWEPDWFPVDLIRALVDLGNGGAQTLLWIGSGEPSIPISALAGRWELLFWDENLPAFSSLDIAILENGDFDGDQADSAAATLRNIAASGVPIVATADQGTELDRMIDDLSRRYPGSIIRLADDALGLRYLDAVLLEAVGRGALLEFYDNAFTPAGRKSAGNRTRLWERRRRFYNEDFLSVEVMKFGSGELDLTDEGFLLRKTGDEWILESGNWTLPARQDRILGFLERLVEGDREIWLLDSTERPEAPGVRIRFLNKRKQVYDLAVVDYRQDGKGALVEIDDELLVWPRILPDEVNGDPRYWMDRRLWEETSFIRIELTTPDRLYWRLHEENGTWKLTDRNGVVTDGDGDVVSVFLQRFVGIEAATLTPLLSEGPSPLTLITEDIFGGRREFRLADYPDGRVAAESEDGVAYILDETTAALILAGPGSR